MLDAKTCAMFFRADPAPTVCGHGTDSDLPAHAVTSPGKCMCDLVTSVPCADL